MLTLETKQSRGKLHSHSDLHGGVGGVFLGETSLSTQRDMKIGTWNNIRMDLQEVGCGYTDWIGLAQDRERWRTLVSAVMNLWVPWNVGNFLTSCKPFSFSRRTLHHGISKCDRNWARNVENISTYLFTHMSDVQQSINWFRWSHELTLSPFHSNR